ncbi:LysM domain-containing protein [Magnetospirillum sp. LM-5]|uniref:LysM peptidoglycan-binding domain-containing protein n=1 Tax=Magnetospirillum sp. LM-5 TaxID=2681466 RepID=UPI001570280B|nr:LysM domain-containing protein [Magnetospirillum sp. LM-5]
MTEGLKYTIQPGDSYWSIAQAVNGCQGVTADQIAAANPNMPASALQVGQTIVIPAGSQPQPQPVAAANIGYWRRTWLSVTPPAGANLGIAFSGWTDPDQALSNSAATVAGLVGTKYLGLGGGNENGRFSADLLQKINSAIAAGSFAAYQGLAYDVEEGDSGLSVPFAQSFAAAKAAGLKVLVTVSHSGPYGIADAAQLMEGFFQDGNIDFLSPQLYTSGSETANDWATTAGVTWQSYGTAKAAVIPSIVTASLYADAKTVLAQAGVTTQGYVVWNC